MANLLNLRRSWPVFIAMPRTLAKLSRQRDPGLLGYHMCPGRTMLVLQYWESFAQLDAYARAADHAHLPATAGLRTARNRLGRADAEPPEVPAY